mmetsp:Transcript_22196/g.28713  ORF Transcript_22196/g.28713 Transcript_22196/m.28713 type:complete len:179 (+) Transcript_22196:2-538(+)
MHSTKSLREMDLLGSVSLTVMKCAERGLVKRGDLETRLVGAQGDAMDVEGLSYEALQELTERVGASETAWSSDHEYSLNQNSFLISPADHLAQLDVDVDKDGNNDDDHQDEKRRCPICLGDFDPSESEPCLRELKPCRHADRTFHDGCLRTWLKTRSSCPICKASLISVTEKTTPAEL